MPKDRGYIYLIHFAEPIAHARHYLGAARDLEARIEYHKKNRGSRLIAEANRLEIQWWLTRLWQSKAGINPFHVEKALKARGRRHVFCPLCYGKEAMKRGVVETCNGKSGAKHPLIAKVNSEILGLEF